MASQIKLSHVALIFLSFSSHLFGFRASVSFKHWVLTGLIGDYKSHHPRHLSLLLLYPTYWPRKSVVDTIDFSMRFIQHLFYFWHPPTRSHRNSVPISLCKRNTALYKRWQTLKWGAEWEQESCLEWFTEVIAFMKMYVSVGNCHWGRCTKPRRAIWEKWQQLTILTTLVREKQEEAQVRLKFALLNFVLHTLTNFASCYFPFFPLEIPFPQGPR